MGNLINYESTAQQQKNNTINYFNKLKAEGVEILTPEEVKEKLAELGYKIDNYMSHNYYNNLNSGYSYLAKSVGIMDIKTKQSFAHFEQQYTNAENLEKLQKIRRNCVAFDGKRIWDL